MASGQQSLQDLVRTHRLAINLGAVVAIALLGTAAWCATRSGQALHPVSPQQESNTATVAPACTHAAASFCPTEARYRTFVATQAVSDIIESQVVTRHICSDQNANDRYCNGVSSGLILPLYDIVDNGQAQLFTRNDAIAYLRSFFAANGTPVYQATNPGTTQGTLVIVFASPTGKAHLLLYFTEANGGWQFAYPETATGTAS